jgi:thiamine monophosphate synthase
MFRHNAQEVLATGVDSIAVMRDITTANAPETVVREWLELFPQPAEIYA